MSSVKESMKTYEQKFAEATTSSQRLALSVQQELHTLACNDNVNNTLREQVTEHREVKATLREQLCNEQRTRDKMACEVQRLRIQDEDQRRRILALEFEMSESKRRAEDAPSIMLRVHDLESANKVIQTEKDEAESKAQRFTEEMQQKAEEVAIFQSRVIELEKQLQESTSIQDILRNERTSFEKEADARRAADKRDIIEAARRKAERLRNQSEDEKHQLRLKLGEAENEIQKLSSKQQEVIATTSVHADLMKSRKCVETLEKDIEKQASIFFLSVHFTN